LLKAKEKMFKYLFDSLAGIEIYAIASLFFFMAFFFVIVNWVIRMDKNYIKKMGQLPLDSQKNDGDQQNG
jgi:membrane protein CcdC involved in cytochrome C biogenesis